MRCTNDKVVARWARGLPAKNHRANLTADDAGALWSYDLKIGQRTGEACIVADFTAGAGGFRSQTTSCHVGRARHHADLVMHPTVWATSPLSNRFFAP